MRDWLGQDVTAGEPATIAAIDDFIEGFLSYETRSAEILKAVEAEPEAPLANAYAAIFYMFMESGAAPALAEPFVRKAEAAAGKANDRERRITGAARAWVDGDILRAIRIGEETAALYPHELALAKVTQYHHFNLGDSPGMLRIAHAIGEPNAELPYTHGLAAFAYEQCHLLRDAEASARKAIEIRRKEPWAHHALAHVLLTEGRTREGRAFLDDVKETWTDLNSFMFTHNWWHMGLVLIDQGETDEILRFYDRNIWGVWKEYSQDQIGAVALLARLELVGVDVGDRWLDVAEHCAARVDDHVQPFLSMQYLYGLARAGRPETGAMMDNIRRKADAAPDFVRAAWRDVAVPACEGLVAHATGDSETAVRKLGIALPRLTEIGGSHAQRDLFDQIYLDALIRTNRLIAAQRLLEQRRVASPEARPAYVKLETIYRQLGLPREAARMQAALKQGELSR